MSRAFVKEDDDAGFTPPPSSSVGIPAGPFRVTATGAKKIAASENEAVRASLARAEVLPAQVSPDRAALGVTVRVADDRAFRLVTPEEYALLGEGVSIQSPLGRALLGAAVGDVREVRAPKGNEEIEIVALEGEA